jgi:Flp pilus assembly protein TadD
MHARAIVCCALAAMLSAACGEWSAPSTGSAASTFNKELAPFFWKHCGGCHRPDGSAPFSLLTFDDVRSHARLISNVLKDGTMPPWLPEPGHGNFAGERRVTAQEIERFERWAADGAPRGGAEDLPPQPVWPGEWPLGQPDLVLDLPDAFELSDSGPDVFRNFVIPIQLPTTRFVRGVDVRPGSRTAVHHATILIDTSRESRRLDEADPAPGYEGMLPETVHNPESHALGWTPGKSATFEPEGVAWRLEPGSDLVLEMHMIPTGKPEAVRPRVGLYFTDPPPTRVSLDFKLGSKTIDIPAGAAEYTIDDEYTLPVDVDLLSIYPHAHYLAKDMKAFATLPGGAVTDLLWIKRWDFKWQDQYRYVRPIALPRGTTITMRYSYDNSAGNPRNPHRPPRRVQYGPESTDEMGDLWLQFVARSAEDTGRLASSYREHELRKDLIAAERLVAQTPADARWRNLLGARYIQAERVGDALTQLNEAVRLAPRSVEVRFNLGRALQARGNAPEAVRQFREAARLAPRDDTILIALANALQDQDRTEEAATELRRAININPNAAEAHNNLGVALGMLGRLDDAVEHFRRALQIRPDYPDAQRNLAAALQAIGSSARR